MDRIFGNASVIPDNNWVQEPTSRGTFSILSTCLITLGLCVWTVIHLNVPGSDEQPSNRLSRSMLWKKLRDRWPLKYLNWPAQRVRRVGWTLLGFLAPELVALTAYYQYKEAASLRSEFREILSTNVEDGTGRVNEWTLTHSFLVLMGGLQVVVKDRTNDFFPLRQSSHVRSGLTLTGTGLRFLARTHPELIEDMPLQQIQDKSKGSAIAKTLVCFQASWFCVQCLTRLGQGLAISILELNTFAHAICALAIYVLWWQKPLDIEVPIQIPVAPGPESEVIAIMCVESKMDRPRREGPIIIKRIDGKDYFRLGARIWPWTRRLKNVVKGPEVMDELLDRDFGVDLPVEFTDSDISQSHQHVIVKQGVGIYSDWPTPTHAHQHGYFDIPKRDLRRYLFYAKSDSYYRLVAENSDDDMFTDRVRNTPKLHRLRRRLALAIGFPIVGLAYGGIHCIAWNAPFATEVERLCWRISSITLCSTWLLVLLLYTWGLSRPLIHVDFADNLEQFVSRVMPYLVFEAILDLADSALHPRLAPLFENLVVIFLVFPFIMVMVVLKLALDLAISGFILLYISARIFLVVECFMNLAHLPETAYNTPEWSEYVPHIS